MTAIAVLAAAVLMTSATAATAVVSTTGDGVTTYSCRPDRYAKITDEGVFPHAGDPRALVGYQP